MIARSQKTTFLKAAWPVGLAVILFAFYLFYRSRALDGDEHTYENFTNAIRTLINENSLSELFSLYQTERYSNVTSLPGYFLVVAYLKVLFPGNQDVYRIINVILLFFSGLI